MSTSGAHLTGETLDERTQEELQLDASATPEPGAPVELVHGPAPELADDTQEILLRRLRVGCLVLLGGFFVFTVRGFMISPDVDLPAVGGSVFMQQYRTAVTLALAMCAAFLWSPLRLSLFTLRAIEIGVFGSAIGYCVLIQQQLLNQAAHPAIPGGATLSEVKAVHPFVVQTVLASSITIWFAIELIYGVFIPNTWNRAAGILAVILAIPVVMVTTFDFHSFGLELHEFQDSLAQAGIVLMIGYATAVYSSYAMGRLRREAFVARQYGQYRLGERLGTGGMGDVYLAEHQMLKRPCAIKTIRSSRANDARTLARFEREVRATAQLNHWNVVEIYDYGRTDEGTFYYVMEYLPGLSLQQMVEEQGTLQPERAVHLLRQVCQGLAEAHRQGLIHRDIKPSNIVSTQRGGRHDVVKLLDFGLAATAADLQPASGNGSAGGIGSGGPGQVAGSPSYLAPEVISGGVPGVRSDLYSLGGVAYFLLAGRPPFRGANAIEIMKAQVEEPVIPLVDLNPAVPADLEVIVQRLLDKTPARRFENALALERALAGCQCADRWPAEIAARWWVAKPTRSVSVSSSQTTGTGASFA